MTRPETANQGTAPEEMRSLARLLDGIAAMDEGRTGNARYRLRQVVADGAAEPSLEVGHAARALAELDAMDGDLSGAEGHIKRAVTAFREAARVHPSSRVRAQEGEGASLLLGGEIMLRRGQTAAGDALLGRARVIFERLGDERSAEAWAATGRLARLPGDTAGAEAAWRTSIECYERAENVVGHAEGLVDLAMLRRSNDRSGALRMVDIAASMARNAGRVELLGRVMLARGMVVEDVHAAQDAYTEALERAQQAGSRALAGLALVGLGSRGWDGGERALLAGSQVLLDVEHYPGFGLSLLRIGQHGNQVGDPELALAAAEAAWRVYRTMDPVEGLARVLKLAEHAFTTQRMPRLLLTVTFARAAVIGRSEPAAVAVRDHYAARAPAAWVARLAGATRDTLLSEARKAIQQGLVPALRRFGLLASSFATAQGALDVIGVLAGVSPRAAARQLAPWAPQPVPNELPEAELPEELGAGFAVRTTVRWTVPQSPAPAQTSPSRSRRPVYDPDGRLAEMVTGTLDFSALEEAIPTGGGSRSAAEPVEEFPPDVAESPWSPGRRPGAAPEEPDEPTEETDRRKAEEAGRFDPSGWNTLLGEGWLQNGGRRPPGEEPRGNG